MSEETEEEEEEAIPPPPSINCIVCGQEGTIYDGIGGLWCDHCAKHAISFIGMLFVNHEHWGLADPASIDGCIAQWLNTVMEHLEQAKAGGASGPLCGYCGEPIKPKPETRKYCNADCVKAARKSKAKT